MTVPRLEAAAARRLFLDRHALLEPPVGAGQGAALLDVIDRLGFVQVDSVQTLARAHDLILWSRRGGYRPKNLRWLNDCGRQTFEHWTHDAAIIPMAFYPYWKRKFARDRARLQKKWVTWQGGAFQDEVSGVLDHVRQHGAVCSSDMLGEKATKSTGWWDWHPSKTALEYLWRTGALAVSKRQGFRKFYDLAERVIPAQVRDVEHTEAEIIDWCCAAALDRLGFATSGELAAFWDIVRPGEAKEWVAASLASGRITPIDIICQDGAPRRSVMWPETQARAAQLPDPAPRLRVLSPFDPALRDRKRAERLFGFHYRIEIFVPAPKRRYGYYVFPLLEGDRLVGRAEIVTDRPMDAVVVKALWPEASMRWTKSRQAKFEAEMLRLTKLTGCSQVKFESGWLRH